MHDPFRFCPWVARCRPLLVAGMVALGWLLAAPLVPSATINWTNTAGGSWETAGNWSLNTTPLSTNSVTLYAAGSYTVRVDNATADTDPGGAGSWMQVGSVTMGNGAGDNMTLLVGFTNASKTLLSSTLQIGSVAQSSPTLLITSGVLRVGGSTFSVGTAAGATGLVRVTGGSLVVTNTTSQKNNFYIGENGVGQVEILGGTNYFQGAIVGRQTGSVGTWTLSGGSNLFLGVGALPAAASTFNIGGYSDAGATGTMVIAGGTFMATNLYGGTLYINDGAAGSYGKLLVSGGTSTVYATVQVQAASDPSMAILEVDGGVLNVRGGGIVSIGGSSGPGTFLMTGGELEANAFLVAGGKALASSIFTLSNGVVRTGLFEVNGANKGSGVVNLNGGRLVSTNFTIGKPFNASTGTVTVSDSAVLEMDGPLYIGPSSGTGYSALTNRTGGTLCFTNNNPSITVMAGCSLVVTNAVVEFMNAGAVVLTNGSSIMAKPIYQGSNTLRLLNSTNAVLRDFALTNGGSFQALRLAGSSSLWQSTNLLIGAGGSLSGSGRVQANMVTNAGTVSPGNSPGTLTFSSNLTLLGSSVLKLEISGTNWSAYDHLVVEGIFAKGGAIFVTNLGGALAVGNSFDFWDAALTNGSFLGTNTWVLPDLAEDLSWDTSLFETQGILSVMTIPEPSALLALGAGLALLLALRRRRRVDL